MKTPIILFCFLVTGQLVAQDYVQFHSEEMKNEFIDAGADLNGDGVLTVAEAAQVEELFFTMSPRYSVQRKEARELSAFSEYALRPSYRACSNDLPDYLDNDDDCECGIPDQHEEPYDFNFQGLEYFTQLKHLGIWKEEAVSNLTLPVGLLSFAVDAPHIENVIFPAGSQLNAFLYRSSASSNLVDLSNCALLKELELITQNSEFELPALDNLEVLVSDSQLDFSNQSFPMLEYLDLEGLNNGIDINVLPKLTSFHLSTNYSNNLTISNSIIEEVGLRNCAANIRIESCQNLKRIESIGSNLLRVADNPRLENAYIQSQATDIEIANCNKLEILSLGALNIESIALSNLPSLTYFALAATSIADLSIDEVPSLLHLKLQGPSSYLDVDLDFSLFPSLEYLFLGRVKMEQLDLGELPGLKRAMLSKHNINSILLEGSQIEKLYSLSLLEYNVQIESGFNPRELSLINANIPGWNCSGLDRIEKLEITSAALAETLDFSASERLEYLFVKQSNPSTFIFCNASDKMHISIPQNTSGENLRAFIPNNSGQIEEICAGASELELYNCDGTFIGLSDEVALSSETLDVNFEFKIAPNPTTDYIYWNYPTSSTTTQIAVYNLSGRQVLKAEANSKLYLGDLSPGIYLVNFVTEEGTVSERVLVK